MSQALNNIESSNAGKNVRLVEKAFPTGFWSEVKGTGKLAWPVVLTQICTCLFPPIACMFCGHLGKIELDAVSLANSIVNVTGLSVIIGFSAACDTLYAQTFGSTNKKSLGIVLQRGTIILLLVVLPCWAIHMNGEVLLLAFGQQPEVSRLAGQYLLVFMPGMVFFSLYISISKYIQAQNVVIPNLLIGLFSTGLVALFHYIFIYVMDMGINGSAIAQVIGYFSMMLLTAIYIKVSGIYKETWHGWDIACLQDWGVFFSLGLFGFLVIGIEWWTYEIGIFLSGILGSTDLGAQTVMCNVETICYMIPIGIGIAASIRVGHYLGAGNAAGAKTAARVSFIMAFFAGSIVAILIGSLHNLIPKIFTNVTEVIELAAAVLPILAILQLPDATIAVGGYILRGQGRQHLGAALLAVTYSLALAAGVPTLLLADIGISGYWFCLVGAQFITAGVMIAIVHHTDWELQALAAKNQAEAEGELITQSIGSSEKDEHTPILGSSTMRDSGHSTTSPNTPSSHHVHLGHSTLLWRRGLTVLILLLIFIIGIIARILTGSKWKEYYIPDGVTEISSNGTFNENDMTSTRV